VRGSGDKWHEEMADTDHGSLSELAQTLLTNKVTHLYCNSGIKILILEFKN